MAEILDFNNVKVEWLGHDGFKFYYNGLFLYIDPFEAKDEKLRDKSDIVLITHSHYDHCSEKDLKKIISEKTQIFCPYDVPDKLKTIKANFNKMKPNDKLSYKDVIIEAVPSYNINKPFHPRQNEWLGFIFTINGIKFYHTGDSDFIPEMSEISCDVAFLPVSGTYVMNVNEAVEAARKIMPKVAIPMHYGKIVGEVSDAEKFKKLCTFCQVKIMEI
ncbi:MAG: MBL fold metallo-hydrolase [Candidatus Woesearchaeota archaeon]